MQTLNNIPDIEYITRCYAWNLITADLDYNKFPDRAIAGQARFVVSEDRHFNVLREGKHPFITAIKIAEFKIIMGK